MLAVMDGNATPRNLFKGEVFLSRFGLHIDERVNLESHRALFRILDSVDGTLPMADIALRCGVSFQAVKVVIDKLAAAGLVEWQPRHPPMRARLA
jgi:aminopeptidase-like protein